MLLYTGFSHTRTNTYYVHPQCCYIPVCHTLEPIRITYTHNVVIYRFVTRQNQYVLCTPTMLLYTGLSHTRTNTYYVHHRCRYTPVCHTLEPIRITYTHNVVIYRFVTRQNQYVLRTPTMLLYTGLSHQNQYVLRTPTMLLYTGLSHARTNTYYTQMLLYTGLSHTRTNTYYVHPQCCYIPVCHTLEPIRITYTIDEPIRIIHPQCCYIPVCHTLEPIRITYTHNVVIYRFVTLEPILPIRITYTHNVVIYRFVTRQNQYVLCAPVVIYRFVTLQNQYVLLTPTMLLYTGLSHTRTNTYQVHPQCCYIPVCHTLEPIRISYTHNVVIYRFVTRQNQYVLRTPTMLLYTGLSHTRTNTYYVHPQCCYIPVCQTLEPIRIMYTHNVVIYRFVTLQNQYV